MPFKSISILGCRIDVVTWPDIDQFCRTALTGSQARQIVTINGEIILQAEQQPDLKEAINQADLVIADSTNVIWVSQLKGRGLPARTPGSDLVNRLAQLATETGQSIFLLGGRPGIAERAGKNLQTKFPGLKIAGTSYADPNQLEVVQVIKKSGAAIVLVGYGAPKQELWIKQHKVATGAKLLVGVGGTFDMLAGLLPRAPEFLRALHLEWLWRLFLQPSRLGRILRAVVVFPIRAFFS